MPLYRVYVLGEHGQLESVLNLDCADDVSAKERVRRLADGYEWSFGDWSRNSKLMIRGTGPSGDEAPSHARAKND
jgi:hypothetical protein